MSLKPIPAGEVVDGNICKHMDKRFLSAVDLIGLGEVELVIDRVEHHDKLEYENHKKAENVNLLYFKGTDKPLTLNVTNTKAIIYITGTGKVSEWGGKKIKLAAKEIPEFGGNKFAVRVVG